MAQGEQSEPSAVQIPSSGKQKNASASAPSWRQKVPKRSFPDAESACSALSSELGCDVIVTDGVRGAVAIWNGRMMGVPAPTRAGRFPAGSGDAFLGGLLSGIERGDDVEAALRAARDAAERNSRVPGQGILAGA